MQDLRLSIRKEIRKKRNHISSLDQTIAANDALSKIKQLPRLQEAENIAIYLTVDGELDTHPTIEYFWQNGKNGAKIKIRQIRGKTITKWPRKKKKKSMGKKKKKSLGPEGERDLTNQPENNHKSRRKCMSQNPPQKRHHKTATSSPALPADTPRPGPGHNLDFDRCG
jgi:5-formyltetrahydrofolate cyclo-ligase